MFDLDNIAGGWYPKPHCLSSFTQEKKMTKSEFIVYDLLLHFENRYRVPAGGWFYVTDKTICKTRLISPRSLVKVRRSLKEKGFIEIEPGRSHWATMYKIVPERIPCKREVKTQDMP